MIFKSAWQGVCTLTGMEEGVSVSETSHTLRFCNDLQYLYIFMTDLITWILYKSVKILCD